MDNTTPGPVGFHDAIENVVSNITCTDDTIVEIEDTLENEIRIATIANVFNVSPSKVEQAIVEEIKYQLNQDPPDKELTEHLISEQREEFQRTGD